MRISDDWIDFKKSFTKRQEDALWQYFMDHARLQPNGYFGILFYIKNIDDFWQRLFARYSGIFLRYDAQKKGANGEAYRAIYSQAKKGEVWDQYDCILQGSRYAFLWRFLIRYAKKEAKNKSERLSTINVSKTTGQKSDISI